MPKEPKYVITVEVRARRITNGFLNTSLDRWLLWSAGEREAPVEPRRARLALQNVKHALDPIKDGMYAVESGAQQVALNQLVKDIERSSTCSLKADS